MPKSNEIDPNEAAKMIVRGILFDAPDPIKDKYKSFVFPFSLSKDIQAPNEASVPPAANQLLECLVNELKSIKPITQKDLTIAHVQQQVISTLSVANKYVKPMEETGEIYYKGSLNTIMNNIKSRNVVLYNSASYTGSRYGANFNSSNFGFWSKSQPTPLYCVHPTEKQQLENFLNSSP